ncbi:MAG: metallophosphoesterase [Candidatus Aminicenantes bacterium]|nr:MAG: metallophosphoesterase [Candidatus Aminicenantes bacterium]
MRLAIISDIHLGDTLSVMAFRDQSDGSIQVGCRYNEFKEKVKEKFNGEELDHLVLLGDIFDFTVASSSEAYAIAKFFFEKLKEDRIAKEIIFVPGNHDFEIWNTVEFQVNVTNRVKKGKYPTPFRMSVPGIIDDREGEPTRGFTLHNVTARKEKNKPKYAGLFLDDMTKPTTPFNFVYPNLYLVTRDETVLITHGHYLEMFWSVVGKWGLKIINGDLDLKDQDRLDLKEMVGMNFPLSQLSSSGLGQSGPLVGVIQKLGHQMKEHDMTGFDKYFTRLGDELRRLKIIRGCLQRLGFKYIKKKVLKALASVETMRYRIEFHEDPKVRERFKDFYNSTVYEIDEIKNKYRTDIPLPTRMIFGHTHQPIPWGSPKAPSMKPDELPQLPKGKIFTMYNSGGWLNKMDENNQPLFCGAEIFFYDTGEGFSSESIGYNPGTALGSTNKNV